MDQATIFGPFFAMMFLTLAVWVYMYIRRISFISASKLSPKSLAVPGELARLSPPAVSNPSHNLKNLFEIPVAAIVDLRTVVVRIDSSVAILVDPPTARVMRFAHARASFLTGVGVDLGVLGTPGRRCEQHERTGQYYWAEPTPALTAPQILQLLRLFVLERPAKD